MHGRLAKVADELPAARMCVATVQTDLGWIALAGSGTTIAQISFARGSRKAALSALDRHVREGARICDWNAPLAARLVDFAAGAADDFRDVELDLRGLTPFQQRIVEACRAIGYGQTRSYGQVAAAAGNSRAARAVGNTMAANRFALVVPCHRVVHAGGDTGRLSGAALQRKQLRRLEQYGPSSNGIRRQRPARRGKSALTGA